ncbi:molybdopterin cofactor-binding domain-containing protein [Salipiger sp.]|uniref:molybdopterin cofactor-binding domain-containing protein n=1 Tax=Salipiger sp. TaxID=2078585 RepID=UPI003A97730C
MKFDAPAGPNPVDRMKVVGQPLDRVDGPLKVTGRATYSHEQRAGIDRPAYGFVLGAGIGYGRIAAMDLAAARAAPGVLTIVTADSIGGPTVAGDFLIDRFLVGPQIDHYHQAIAVVVAETFEQARAATALIDVTYEAGDGSFDIKALSDTAPPCPPRPFTPPSHIEVGDFDAAMTEAEVTLDETYTTPDQTHAMMEPFATIAQWDGDRLTCWCQVQQLNWGLRDLAKILGIDKANIRLHSPFIGGSFGAKGTVLADCVLASLAARQSGRAVKLALHRALIFNNTNHRPATVQRIRLGATKDGRLTAIGHDSCCGNLPGGRPESAIGSTRLLYGSDTRRLTLRLARLDLAEAAAFRAPGEATGMMALEIAMDEMAEKLGLDPVEFRIRNDITSDPENQNRKFSSRNLVGCLLKGAEHFGWADRPARPATRRDGHWLTGYGTAAAIRGAPILKSAARVRLTADGRITVETDMTDVGTGSYTIVGQTAAEMMGLGIGDVTVRLGDSSFPESPGTGGQWGAPSVTSGVYAACVKLRDAVAQRLGINSPDVTFEDGHVIGAGRRVPIAEAAQDGDLVCEDEIFFGEFTQRYAHQTFGAHFVELGVHAATGEVRLRRMLAVCDAGRIFNPKAARSQVIGAQVMGAGAALMEDLSVDTTHGLFLNHDLGSYEVPVHADIAAQEVIFLEEPDPRHSPMKGKGVGELGMVGVAAAVANAIYNATGVRVRDYPITVDKYIDRMPQV